MKKRIFAILMAICTLLPAMNAQSLWTSAEVSKKITKSFGMFIEGEYRTHNRLSSTERWSGSLGAEYKFCSNVKATAAYTYIHQHTLTETTRKGNIIPAYWQPKHRGSFAITGDYKFGNLSVALRERYQYTYRTEQFVPKFDSDGISPKEDEFIKGKGKHVLRSRLELEYKISKKCKFTPYASAEIYNLLNNGCCFKKEKIRWTIGTGYKINKKHSLDLYYRYIDASDDDEEGGHIIGIGYKFKL